MVVFDNACANDGKAKEIKNFFPNRIQNLWMIVFMCTHILNIIVQDTLNVIDRSIKKFINVKHILKFQL